LLTVQFLFDSGLNTTALAATKTASTATAEYNTMYFWYVKTLTLFLPYTMMLVTGVTLCLRSRGDALATRYTAVKHASAAAISRRMKVSYYAHSCLKKLSVSKHENR
jgi:hypothetical protein